MAGFLEEDEEGPVLAEVSWDSHMDSARVLKRLDMQLHTKFEKIDAMLEEQQSRSLSVAELIKKWEDVSSKLPVDLGTNLEQNELRSLQALGMRFHVQKLIGDL